MIALTASQERVRDTLIGLPGAWVVTVRAETKSYGPDAEGSYLVISGGASREGKRCPTCDNEVDGDYWPANFRWENGRFRDAIVAGRRRPSIEQAMRAIERRLAR